jgi:hypothetical protein
MTGPNGHADSNAAVFANGAEVGPAPACIRTWDESHRFTHTEIKRYTDELEVPFDPRVIEWRVTNTSQDKSRGQVIPYADQRAYTDRLDAQIHHPHQREFRARQRSEACCQGAGHL